MYYVLHCAPSCSQSVDVLSCFEKLDARASVVCATGPVLCTKQEDTAVKAIPRCGVAGACCILKFGNGILCQQYAFAIYHKSFPACKNKVLELFMLTFGFSKIIQSS